MTCQGVHYNFPLFQTWSAEIEHRDSKIRELQLELDRATSRAEHLRSQNDVLGLTLEDSKSLTDRLTVLLGRHESNNAALQLALNYCDYMIESYDVLVALVETEAGILAASSSSSTSASSGDSIDGGRPIRQALSNRRSAEVVARHLVARIDKSFSRSDSGCRGSSERSSRRHMDIATGWEDSSGYSQTTRYVCVH